jgi:hypothetical protein
MKVSYRSEHDEDSWDSNVEAGGGCLGMMVGIALVATIAVALGGYLFVKFVLGA